MRRIFKYVLDIDDRFLIEMPEGAKILSVQMQYEKSTLWALVDDDKPKVERKFAWFGTGHDVPVDAEIHGKVYIWEYRGSVLMKNDTLVFHLFEAT